MIFCLFFWILLSCWYFSLIYTNDADKIFEIILLLNSTIQKFVICIFKFDSHNSMFTPFVLYLTLCQYQREYTGCQDGNLDIAAR